MSDAVEHEGPWRPAAGVPTLRKATFSDLREALSAGLHDFRRAPWIGMALGALYALGGILLIALMEWREMRGLTFPLVAGYALIGPFCGTILYEMSRRLETGTLFDWSDIPGMIAATARKQIIYHGFILMFWLAIWSRVALLIYYAHFGLSPKPFLEVAQQMLTSPTGISFLVLGIVVGAIFALVAFALSVIAFPFLLDRDADFITAMVTSFQAVLKSPLVMTVWGIFIAGSLFVASFPLFLGYMFALPILGHSSWHLYRRLVQE